MKCCRERFNGKTMKTKPLLFVVVASVGTILALPPAEAQMSGGPPPRLNVTILTAPSAAAQQVLHGHVPEAIARLHLQPIGRLPATNRLHLAIGLPLRNREALASMLEQLYDPASTNYHHYLTPPQFTDKFGPTEQDYQAVINFAKTNGLTVVGTYPNRALVEVDASVVDIERTFRVRMLVYQHPTERRIFYAADAEPSIDFGVALLVIGGLDNYIIPHPAGGEIKSLGASAGSAAITSSGPFWGWDFRLAYLGPDVTLLGSGQSVGLFELANYNPGDILQYENAAGIPFTHQAQNPVTLTNVLVGGGTSSSDSECGLDIEMVISMAPGLSKVVVYEGYSYLLGTINNVDAILNTMANDTNNSVNQFSCSWFFNVDANAEQSFLQFIAQGQSFLQASGDGDAWVGQISQPGDDTNITIVGGTTLTVNSLDNSYNSETVWNSGYYASAGISGPWPVNGSAYWGSGGGVSTTYSIPAWQQGVNMTINGGSTKMRNVPDVAMVADYIEGVYNGTTGTYVGTSYAAPLWASFTALVNQQCALNNPTNRVGFLNPALYYIGKRPPASFYPPFHDIADYSNNGNGQNAFYAVPGYDLCTGWGTPNGTNLINALVAMPPVFTNQPQSQNVTVGSTVILNVGVTGSSPFSYQWFWNDVLHPLHDGRQISGSLTSTLTITNVQTTNAGTYFVEVGNPATGVTSGNAVLNVYVTAPSGTITFDDLTTPNVSGEFHYGSFSIYDGLNWNNCGVMNGVLATNTGYYAGVVSSSNVVYNNSGSAAYFYSGSAFDLISASLTAAWNDNLQVQVLGVTGSTITYSNVYTLSATNQTLIHFNYLGVTEVYFASAGGTKHAAYTAGSGTQFAMDNVVVTTNLSVATSPQIVTQPTNQSSLPGSKVTFTVSATGAASLNYQWQKNGSVLHNGGNIFGSTTTSLTVSNISTADVGNYSVTVSNPYGSVVSTNAGLSVYVTGSPFLITFDDLTTTNFLDVYNGSHYYYSAVPTSYSGLTWNNFGVTAGVICTNSGAQAAVVSPNNVAFNWGGNPASISCGVPFNLVSAYLTAMWNDNLQLEVQGYLGNTLIYDKTNTLSAVAPTLIAFNYLNVNQVSFRAFGGTPHTGYSFSDPPYAGGPWFAMDNVTVAANLPLSILPTIQTSTITGNAMLLSWPAMMGQTYQVQYKTNLAQTSWSNLGAPIIATTSTIYVPDSTTNSQRYYRIFLMP
jgi:subtilase family serine protease